MRLTVYARYTDFALMSLGAHVAFGSLANICAAKSHVRFTPITTGKAVIITNVQPHSRYDPDAPVRPKMSLLLCNSFC
jgi:hypothetical protein